VFFLPPELEWRRGKKADVTCYTRLEDGDDVYTIEVGGGLSRLGGESAACMYV